MVFCGLALASSIYGERLDVAAGWCAARADHGGQPPAQGWAGRPEFERDPHEFAPSSSHPCPLRPRRDSWGAAVGFCFRVPRLERGPQLGLSRSLKISVRWRRTSLLHGKKKHGFIY